jgi:gas vesicle protein
MAINIDIAANTRDFQRGTKDVEAALTDVGSSLDDLARDTQQSAERAGDALGDGFKSGADDAARTAKKLGDDIGDSVKDGAKDAARSAEKLGDDIGDSVKDGTKEGDQALEKLERSFKEVADASKRSDPGKPLGTSVKKGTDEGKEGLRDFREEANSTAKESAASFDGSAESIGDSFQEIAANAFAGFGPAGAIAGLAAAAGLGVIFSQLEKNDERTQQLREQVAALSEEYIDTGRVGSSSMSAIAENIKAMALATEDGETSLADLRESADKAGVPFEQLAKAMAGDTDALDELLEATSTHIDLLGEQATRNHQGAAGFARASTSAEKQRDALILLRRDLEKQKTTTDDATAATENYADTGAAAMERAAAASEDYSDQIQDAYQEAGAGIDDYAEGGKDALRKYTEEAKKQADAVTAYQTNMVKLSGMLSDEALAYVQSLGPEAAPIIADFIKAPLGQRKETAAVWSQLGSTSSNAFASKVRGDLNRANFTAPVRMRADMSNVNAELQRTRTINIIARVQNNIASQLPARQGMGVP